MSEKLRVFTAFSGYDSQCLALNLVKERHPGFEYELVGWSEIDTSACQAHNALFPEAENLNLGDISKIDWSKAPDFDLFTYSSPCQDFSSAGKQAGGVEGSGTRSSLLWECRKTILTKKPKYLLMENVKALTSQKFMPLFQKWLDELESFGYTNYWKVLNAKDYGVPQNRERVFVISIRNDVAFNHPYQFPQPVELDNFLEDRLEQLSINDDHYLDAENVGKLLRHQMTEEEYAESELNGDEFYDEDEG